MNTSRGVRADERLPAITARQPEALPRDSTAGGEAPVHGCTVCTVAGRRDAFVLAESFLDHHPGGTFTVLVVDADVDHAMPLFVRHDLFEIAIDALRFGSQDPADLLPAETRTRCLVLRPWLLSTLLDAGRSPCVLINVSGLVMRSLESFCQSATSTGAAFIARILEPILPSGPVDVDDITDILANGLVEPGLLAITDSPGGRNLLRWWKATGERGAQDPRLLDAALAFGHPLVRDAGLGLSRWNVLERPLAADLRGLYSGDAPLRYVMFDGLAPTDASLLQHLVANHQHLLRDMERRS